MNENTDKKNVYLIFDGNSIMNRTFYGIKLLTTKDGIYTNAVYGFLNIYYMLMDKIKPTHVAVTFDVSKPTFRHEMYSEYKAHRKSMPDELRPQMNLIKDVLNAMNVLILEKEGYEADDILGTVSHYNDEHNTATYVITGDRDALQLVSDNTTVVIPHTQFGKTEYMYYTKETLFEKYGIHANQVIEVKSLMGDSSDNIPGVTGIGEKKAYGLIQHFGNIDNVYQAIDKNIEHELLKPATLKSLITNKETAYLSKQLATINTSVPIDVTSNNALLVEPDSARLFQIYEHLEFKKLALKLNQTSSTVSVTDESRLFYNTLDSISIVLITDINKLQAIIGNSICYWFWNKSDDMRENYLAVMIDKNIYILDLLEPNLINSKQILSLFCSSNIQKIGYNIKPFVKYCMDCEIDTFNNFSEDIMIKKYLTNSLDNNYTLENISYNELTLTLPSCQKLNNATLNNTQTSLFDDNKNNQSVLEITDEFKRYIFSVLHAIEVINNKLDNVIMANDLSNLYYNIELPLITTLASMEHTGMFVDINLLKAFGEQLNDNLLSLQKDILNMAGEDFNINSPKQLGEVLFDKMQIPYPKKSKTNYSTDKEILEELRGIHPIINMVLEYRMLNKLKTTYVDGISNEISKDGRVHTTFMQTVASTGRLSSIEPNLQNIPVRTNMGGKIRECFVGESDNVIVDADYSQIELRVLAHISKDEALINAFKNNEDIHTRTASEIFKIRIDQVTSKLRSKAKTVNFGIVYGISDYGLAKELGVENKEASGYIKSYMEHYCGVRDYMANIVVQGKNDGYIETIMHRKRPCPELTSSNYMTKQFGERIARNMPIQGSAADIMKLAMIKTHEALKKQNLEASLIMQVHDELLVECPITEVEQVKQILKEAMENTYTLDVPLVVDINVAKNWLDAK